MSSDANGVGSAPGVGEEAYRIPKVAVQVELTLEGGEQLAGHVHLLPVAGRHEGRETVLDLLTSPEHHFLPISGHDGPVRLVHQHRIVLARVSENADAGLGLGIGSEHDEVKEIPLDLELASLPPEWARVTGTIRLHMPPGHQRVLDFLNLDDDFFPIRTAAGLVLVNKEYVVKMTQL